MKCERCDKETNVTSMSYLNTDILCLDCKKAEKNHPRYEEAKKAELDEFKKGNYNYPGLLHNEINSECGQSELRG